MTESKRFSLRLHQAEPCFYELLDEGKSCYTSFGKWITFDDGDKGSFFCEWLNALHEENNQLKERNEFLKKQLDRVCIDNEEMEDKLKKIGRII